MKYLHESVSVAARVCVEDLRRDGGVGGVIALDNAGNGSSDLIATLQFATDPCSLSVTMPMNCSGMYRGVVCEDGIPKTAIFDDDGLD